MQGWSAAVAFVRVDPSQNPNTRMRNDQADSYYRAMTVSFASLRRWNSELPLVLVTNDLEVGAHRRNLDQLGVQVVSRGFHHRPPSGFTKLFSASLYQLDAMAAQAHASTLFLDPDVLCVGPLSRLFARVGGGVGCLHIDYQPDHEVNGLSPRQAGQLHGLLGEPIDVSPHYGGECYAIPARWSAALLERADEAWRLALNLHEARERHFTTEEHILSFGLRGVPTVDLAPDVKRIWTAARFRNVRGDERQLSLWHLPAEKDRGFQELHPLAIDQNSWFWTASADDWTRRIARAMGVEHRRPTRLLRDVAGRLAVKIGC